jgi:hypothetical protein
MKNYDPKHIPPKSKNVINTIRNETAAASEATIQELQYLLSSIKSYKTAVISAIDLNLEKADLVSKYSHADPGGAYNLPGIMANTTASYNLKDVKEDNDRLNNVKSESEQANDESDLYYKMIVSNFNDLNRRLKKLAVLNTSLQAYLQQLENYTDWQSNS